MITMETTITLSRRAFLCLVSNLFAEGLTKRIG